MLVVLFARGGLIGLWSKISRAGPTMAEAVLRLRKSAKKIRRVSSSPMA